jgi:hypothetical protein
MVCAGECRCSWTCKAGDDYGIGQCGYTGCGYIDGVEGVMARAGKVVQVIEDAPVDAVPDGVDVLEPEVVPLPAYSKDGVLLNPQECLVDADGVVRGK